MDPPQLLTDLPDACLQLVMRGLGTRDQLAAAAAASRLRGAAAAALSAIAVPSATLEQLDSVTAYASRHGQHISRLNVGARPIVLPPALLAACPQLRQLQLAGLVLQPGVLGAASGLTKLQLQSCRDPAPHSLATNVAAATGLAHLELCDYCSAAAGEQLPALPGSMLQALPQLTTLVLEGVEGVDDGTLAHLSALTRLQELQLESPIVTAAGLAGLQHLQQLSSLHLLKCGSLAFSGPAVAQLSAMQVLECTGASQFDPAALAAMGQLRRLHFFSTPVAAADTAVLLQQLGGLQQLSHLDLYGALQHSTAPDAAYSALTASSKLAFLGVAGCALPAGAWQHVLTAGRRLPQLRQLHAFSNDSQPLEMGASDAARLAACCPGLESLTAELQPGADLQPLVQLSALTRLVISGVTDTTVAALRHATGSLRVLRIFSPHAFTHEALWHLVSLRQLTALLVDNNHKDEDEYETCYDVSFKAPADGNEDDPPAWQQLLELCEQRVLASEAEVEAKEQEVQDAHEQLQGLQEQLKSAQQRLKERRQHREEAQAHMAGQQQ